MRRGTKAYLAASLVAQASALARYVVLARMVGPTELGLAATLILTAQFFESISDTGADRFIVQDATGDTPATQGLVQLALVIRGVFIACALVLTANLVAGLLHSPALTLSLMALGFGPLIGGFIHLDLRRAQRTGDFRPEAVSTILSELAATAAITFAAWKLRDHTAVVYGLVVRAIVQVVVSHLTAMRPYRWSFSKDIASRFSLFAMPLIMNGLLLFLGSQGDRLIVGSAVGPQALGQYSAILLLIFYPSSAISRFVAGIHMPQVALSRDNAEGFSQTRNTLAGRALVISTTLLVGFAAVGPFVTPLLYGHRFVQPLPLFAGLAFLQATRLLRVWPTTLALGTGDTVGVLIGNVVRTIALPLTILAYVVLPSLYTIVGGFIIAEIAALLVALVRLVGRGTVEGGPDLRRVALFVAIGVVTSAGAIALAAGNWPLAAPCLLLLAILVGATVRAEWQTCREGLLMVRRQLRLKRPV